MASENSNSTSSITEIADEVDEVPKIHIWFALKLNRQNLVLVQSIYPPLSHHFDSVVQKWTTKTDDQVIQNARAVHQKSNICDITRNKILNHIRDTEPDRDHRRLHILPVPSKNIILVFWQTVGRLPISYIGRFDLITEQFEATPISTARPFVESIRTESVVLSSHKNYVVMLNVLPSWTFGINIVDIRNKNEYPIWDSDVKVHDLLMHSQTDSERLLLGATDNTPFVRKWTDHMLRQQEFKDMEIAEVIVNLIGKYYAEPMMHLLQYDRYNEKSRHWMISEKHMLKSMVNGSGTGNGTEWNGTKIKWPQKDTTTVQPQNAQ